MQEIYTWMKQVIGYLCLLELFCQLIPGKNYRRYVRFFGSVIFLISIAEPLLSAFSVEGTFEKELQKAFIQEEIAYLEETRENLAGLQNRKIVIAYENELRRQIRQIIEAANERALRILLFFEENTQEPSALQKIEIELAKKNSGTNVFSENEQDSSMQQRAVSQIRSELAALYGLRPSEISIRIKE